MDEDKLDMRLKEIERRLSRLESTNLNSPAAQELRERWARWARENAQIGHREVLLAGGRDWE